MKRFFRKLVRYAFTLPQRCVLKWKEMTASKTHPWRFDPQLLSRAVPLVPLESFKELRERTPLDSPLTSLKK